MDPFRVVEVELAPESESGNVEELTRMTGRRNLPQARRCCSEADDGGCSSGDGGGRSSGEGAGEAMAELPPLGVPP